MNNEIPPYVDDGRLRQQDDTPLEHYLEAFHDRAQFAGRGQPFFSGREVEINAFRTVARTIAWGYESNATLIFEGPPGSGKSALLDQIRMDMESYPPVGPGGRRWLPVVMDGGAPCAPGEIMRAVDEAIAQRLSEWLLDVKTAVAEKTNAAERLLELLDQREVGEVVATALNAAKRIVGERGISAAGFSIGGGSAPDDPRSILELASLRGGKWRNWQIVLLIDEAQGLSDRTPGAVPGTLSAIHQGIVRLPLSFCAFGLHGTADALTSMRVSRTTGGRHLRLGALSAKESRMAVQRCFKQYGVTHGGPWERAILERCADWPQHIAAYLNASLTVLRAGANTDRALGDARRAPLADALALGDEGRSAYYESRLASMNALREGYDECARRLALWLGERTGDPHGVPKGEILDYLRSPAEGLGFEDAGRFVKASRGAGLLEQLPGGRMRFSIPSFAGHLLGDSVSITPPV